jgi:cysteine synthase A
MTNYFSKHLEDKTLPRILQIENNLHVAAFWLMKLVVARNIIKNALDEGRVVPGGRVIESTSGTMGYGLAMAARAYGVKLTLVGDPAIDVALKNLLEELGADVHIVTTPAPTGGYQKPRLQLVSEMLRDDPTMFWVRQYDNSHNPAAYRESAEAMVAKLRQVDILVAAVGSGGSISGLARFLRAAGQSPRVLAVDTPRSVLFGQQDGSRMLRGLGNSIFPKNLDYSQVDEVHWVSAAQAFCATRYMLHHYGLDLGATSGAAFLVARHLARQHPDKRVVFVSPDRAERYLTTVYSKEWCLENNAYASELLEQPEVLEHPQEAGGEWSMFNWNRRSLHEVSQTEEVLCAA